MSTLEVIDSRIAWLYGRPVLLDSDLARIHHLPIRDLREMVRTRCENFPGDLCFQPDFGEYPRDFGTEPPYAFTEQGVWMLAAMLGTAPALLTTIELSRAFDRIRQDVHGRRSPAQLRFH